MSTVRLDLKAIRKRRLPGFRPSEESQSNGLRLSRRELIGLSGASAATLSPAIRVLGDSLRGPFEFTYIESSGLAVFSLAGQEKWVIDTAHFSGAPKLAVEQSARAIRIELKDARYPGTDLPADFVCDIKRGAIGWKMSLQMALGGFKSDTPFERWLAGIEPATSRIRLQSHEFPLNDRYALKLAGQAEAAFRPDWSIKVDGRDVAAVQTPTALLTTGKIGIALLAAAAASILKSPDSRRTLVTLSRDGAAWPFEPELKTHRGASVAYSENPFDTLRIECSESASGSIRRTFLAESTTPDSTMACQLHTGATLPLRNARYVVAFDQDRERHALLADYHSTPQWLHLNGCSVLVGDGEAAEPFELSGRPERTDRMRIAPALLAFSAPLEGAIVTHGPMESDARLEIAGGEPDGQSRATLLRQSMKSPGILMALGRNQSAQVVRPDDMLALEFEFVNLSFRADAGGPRLVRTNASLGAFLIVHFPPQAIAEQAFLETAGSGGEMPTALPVISRLAGDSRLAFFVPPAVQSIPYTMEGLLDWTKLQPSVVPVALPPPAPLIRFNEVNSGLSIANLTTIGKSAVDEHDLVKIKSAQKSFQKKGLDLTKAQVSEPAKIPAAALLQPVQKAPLAKESASVGILAGILLTPKIREPLPTETAIEAPWRLILSPHSNSAWAHAPLPVTHDGRTELWHTRLAVLRNGKADESDDYYRTVRAVWSADYAEDPAKFPPHYGPNAQNTFRTSIDAGDRNQIVHLSSDYENLKVGTQKVQPRHIPVEHLMLSPLGAFVDLDGKWDPPTGYALMEWQHRATMGRDHYVKVVYAGYLMPFGHKASLIKITERKIVLVGGERVALNRQRMFIVVRELEKTYSASDTLLPYSGRQNPFTDVNIVTRITPLLDDPAGAASKFAGTQPLEAFWPRSANDDFRFVLNGRDREGRQTQFSMPLAFIMKDAADNAAKTTTILGVYNSSSEASKRRGMLSGPKVAFADERVPKGPNPSDTRLETDWISWLTQPPTKPVINRAPFYPAMQAAAVKVSALRTMADHNDDSEVVFTDQYLKNGFGAGNPGEVYVALRGAASNVSFGKGGNADKSGGIASPNIKMTAMSRRFGPVGGSAGAKQASIGRWEHACFPVDADAEAEPPDNGWAFDPKEFFTGDAMLLGGIELLKLIGKGLDSIGDGGKNVPKITTEDKPPNDIKASIDWAPTVIDMPAGLFVAKDKKDCLSIHAEISVKRPMSVPTGDGVTPAEQAQAAKDILATKDSAPPTPTWKIEGKLKDFTMSLFSCIKLHFDMFSFTSTPEDKFKPNPKFNKDDGIQFMGALSFVNDLKNIIPGMGDSKKGMADLDVGSKFAVCAPKVGGFDIGPYIDPYAIGLKAGIKIGVPTISVGVFSLQNIKVQAGIDLPFTGDPVLFQFKFCSADDPFLLTVWIIGGGGFLELEVGAHGLESLTANFQLGAMASIDVGIASGGVYIKMGVTYSYGPMDPNDAKSEKGSTLTGYVQAGGYVNVLGIISLSLELYLGITYQEQPGGQSVVWGKASIEFHVSILFFSFTVSAEVEKTFSGSRTGAGMAGLDRGVRLASLGLPSGLNLEAFPAATGPVAFKDVVEEPDWNEYCASFAFA